MMMESNQVFRILSSLETVLNTSLDLVPERTGDLFGINTHTIMPLTRVMAVIARITHWKLLICEKSRTESVASRAATPPLPPSNHPKALP